MVVLIEIKRALAVRELLDHLPNAPLRNDVPAMRRKHGELAAREAIGRVSVHYGDPFRALLIRELDWRLRTLDDLDPGYANDGQGGF